MKKRVTVITPLDRSFQFDICSTYMFMPRYGSISIATVVRDAGYESRLFCEMSGSTLDWDYIAGSQYVLFCLLGINSIRAYELTKKIRTLTDAPIIFGGSHASVLPEDCLEHCDYVVRNEGEATVVELLKALDNGLDVSNVKGITYKSNGDFQTNPDQPFIKNLDWKVDIRLMHQYTATPLKNILKSLVRFRHPKLHIPVIQTTRGCPFRCEFCFGRRELGGKYRRRKLEHIVEEVGDIIEVTKMHLIMIVDNEFCADKKYSLEILKAIHERYEGRVRLAVFTRIETSRDQQFLKKMKEYGVYMVSVGLESVSDATLEAYNKKQTRKDVLEGVNRFQDEGLVVLGFFVLGADTDTRQTVIDTVDFAIDNRLLEFSLFVIDDFPFQTKLHNTSQMIPDHRFIHHDWRYFNSNHVIHYPKKMRPSVLQREVLLGYRRFFSLKRCAKELFFHRDLRVAIRGWAVSPIFKSFEKYIPYLEKMEEGLYDENDMLIEEKVLQLGTAREKRVTL